MQLPNIKLKDIYKNNSLCPVFHGSFYLSLLSQDSWQNNYQAWQYIRLIFSHHFPHLSACQLNRERSDKQQWQHSACRRGFHRQSLSQDTQRVKNHTVISPYYHRQLILFKWTYFACRHHSLGVWPGEGRAEQNKSGRRGFASAGHRGNAWERATCCLPRPRHSPQVTSSSR